MNENDISQVCAKLNDFLTRFTMYPHFNEEEVAHWFIPRNEVVYSYVVEVRENILVSSSFLQKKRLFSLGTLIT
jgi:glycylpeptide N-tetradecanoyltransferase